eukprot:2421975-Amphidinium_carterae.1
MAYPLSTGFQRFSMRIIDPTAKKSERSSTVGEKNKQSEFAGSDSWNAALCGKHLRATVDAQNAKPSYAAAASASSSKNPQKCEYFSMERPAKKPRNVRALKPADDEEMQDEAPAEDDEEACERPEEEAELDSQGQEISDIEVEEVRSQPASYGFGSDHEDS